MKLLEEFWYGNIEPTEYDTSSKEYKKLQELICRNEEKLRAAMTDDHLGIDGEIISRKTIETTIDAADTETYRIVQAGENVGGVILRIDKNTHHNELEILFVKPEAHSKGIGCGAWQAVEALHPETVVWHTCTPYFEKRNIHFYVNKCGFQIDQFWCEYFYPGHEMPGADNHDPDEGPAEMFRFVKVMK